MKFLALLKKELRECLPWILLVAVALLVIGLTSLSLARTHSDRLIRWPENDHYQQGADTSGRIVTHTPLFLVGPPLLVTAMALGLILGIRQFWLPFFTHTWPYLFHRSVRRTTILTAKFTAAAIGFISTCGITWIFIFRYSNNPDYFPFPTFARVFWEGWIMIAIGYMVYLATALSGLSSARWYTTRIFALAFVAMAFMFPLLQHRLCWAFAIIAVVYLILVMQIIELIQKREF